MVKQDVHNYNRRLDRALKNIKYNEKITTKNKKLIVKFHEFCFMEALSIGRVVRYMYDLRKIAEWIKVDFEKAKREDIEVVVSKIERSKLI